MEEVLNIAKEYASPASRFGAYILDCLVALPFYIPILLSGLMADDTEMSGVIMLIALICFVGLIVFVIWNQIVRMGTTGQSLGKKWLNIAVLSADGKPIGVGQAILREIPGKIVSGLVCYIGYLNVLWDKDKQAWHDKMASSYVYKVGDNFS